MLSVEEIFQICRIMIEFAPHNMTSRHQGALRASITNRMSRPGGTSQVGTGTIKPPSMGKFARRLLSKIIHSPIQPPPPQQRKATQRRAYKRIIKGLRVACAIVPKCATIARQGCKVCQHIYRKFGLAVLPTFIELHDPYRRSVKG